MALKIALAISLLVNAALAFTLATQYWNRPLARSGALTQPVTVRLLKLGRQDSIRLPAGLIVRDASPRGFEEIGQFEPFRFAIIFTSEYDDYVVYNDSVPAQVFAPGLYSLDLDGPPDSFPPKSSEP